MYGRHRLIACHGTVDTAHPLLPAGLAHVTTLSTHVLFLDERSG